nr:trypsin-4-like isoform X1 [Dermacentor andersoni]
MGCRRNSHCKLKYWLMFVLCVSFIQTSYGESKLDVRLNRRGCGVSEPTGRVYNGKSIRKPQIPWIVQIVNLMGGGNGYLCAGSIISHNVILTAAHCVDTKPPPQEVVIYYNTTKPSRGPVAHVVRFMMHPDYDKYNAAKNDIALLKVRGKIRFDRFVRPICLPRRRFRTDGKQLMSGGWGVINNRLPPKFAKTLLYNTFEGISQDKCDQILSHAIGDMGGLDSKLALCAKTNSSTLCEGDSGAPVTMVRQNGKSVQVGVNSLGISCDERGTHVFSVRVYKFMQWITKTLRQPKRWRTLPAP